MKKSSYSLLSTVLVVIISLIAINITVFGLNQRWHYSFEGNRASSDFGWVARYGGTISQTSETSHKGDSCLKLSGRTKAWQSPALKMDDIFDQGGPGTYAITVYVKINEVAASGRKIVRSILRGVQPTSTITLHNTNYFHVIKSVSIKSNEWTCVQGWITVTSDDIYRGEFYWMLDCIDTCSNQVVYIDDFDVYKASDSTYTNQSEMPINIKQFDKLYNYENMPSYLMDDSRIDERAAWYYDSFAETASLAHYELVFTFTRNECDEFSEMINKVLLKQWWKDQEGISLNTSVELAKALLSSWVPMLGDIITVSDVVNTISRCSYAYKSDLSHFYNGFNYENAASKHQSSLQDDVTISVYLLKKSIFGGYEYKIIRSDHRGRANKDSIGMIDEELFNTLVFYCTHILTDGYGTSSYYKQPSFNMVFNNYSYINEWMVHYNA